MSTATTMTHRNSNASDTTITKIIISTSFTSTNSLNSNIRLAQISAISTPPSTENQQQQQIGGGRSWNSSNTFSISKLSASPFYITTAVIRGGRKLSKKLTHGN
ncbi:hypothetical protein PoB_005980800 [Plakobranchus ocellatus]|uniref:Uncharacterized protein n=1 Tax=Plakobranchus ocellatus TaxID=259542 RepID=A0AAV4CMS5_9GAST|nr:hypothetical protein PoB_005980800 [Plakobranchus ocellatus]